MGILKIKIKKEELNLIASTQQNIVTGDKELVWLHIVHMCTYNRSTTKKS